MLLVACSQEDSSPSRLTPAQQQELKALDFVIERLDKQLKKMEFESHEEEIKAQGEMLSNEWTKFSHSVQDVGLRADKEAQIEKRLEELRERRKALLGQ